MELIPDTIDLSAYMGTQDLSAKVRRASDWTDAVLDSFQPREPHSMVAEMFSTKLRERIEFRAGEVTAWAGFNGHRKSMFTGQVALDLCVQRQRVMLASFEMQPERTLARMVRQAAGTGRPTERDTRFFGAWSDNRLWMFDHVGRIAPEQCIAACRYFAAEKHGQQVVIDSMMMVCASEEHLDEQKQFITDCVRMAQETGLHVHLVTHCRKPQTGEERKPSKYDLRGSAAISDQAHNVVTVWANKPKRAALDKDPFDQRAHDEPDAVVTVEKQRNGSFEGSVKLWWHEPSMRFMDDRSSPAQPYRFLTEDLV